MKAHKIGFNHKISLIFLKFTFSHFKITIWSNVIIEPFFELREIWLSFKKKTQTKTIFFTNSLYFQCRYRVRNISVNSNFPNIEYCETPYYGHLLKPLDSFTQVGATKQQPSPSTSQIEFHSSTGKLYRTTLVIDKEKDSIYRRIEELPSSSQQQHHRDTSADQQHSASVPPLRPDGSYRHPHDSATDSNGSVRVYYRRDRAAHTNYQVINNENKSQTSDPLATAVTADSGHGSLSQRHRSTPGGISINSTNNQTTTSMQSPYSTLGKSQGEQTSVDLLHDKWADLMDNYLDNKFRSASVGAAAAAAASSASATPLNYDEAPSTASSTMRKSHAIPLVSSTGGNQTAATNSLKRSRYTNPNDPSPFSFLYSGRDDLGQTASTSSLRQSATSPYQHLFQTQSQSQQQQQPHYHMRGSPITRSDRYPSPHLSVASPTRSTTLNKQQPQQVKIETHQVPNTKEYTDDNTSKLRSNIQVAFLSFFFSLSCQQRVNLK